MVAVLGFRGALLAAVFAAWAAPRGVCAQDAPAPAPPPAAAAGAPRLVVVGLPLEGDDGPRLRGVLQRAVERLRDEKLHDGGAPPGGRRPTLVIEFAPKPGREADASRSGFEPALALARTLLHEEWSGVRTVAFAPRGLKGHAVLAAMACEELALPPDAEFGAAGAAVDAPQEANPGDVAWYEQIAEARGSIPKPVARALIDPRAELLKVESEEGIAFVLREGLAEYERERSVLGVETLAPAGSLALFTGREARDLGLVNYLAADRAALAAALGAPADALAEDQSIQAAWRPVMIDLVGPVDRGAARRVKSLLGAELTDERVNWIGLRIDSTGGDLEAGIELASTLAALPPDGVRTVAYVPARAHDAAALVALACDQVVLHDDAVLGADPSAAAPGGKLPPPGARRPPAPPAGADPESRRAATEAIAARQELGARRPWSLLAAVVDPGVDLYRYTHRETGAPRLMSPREAATLKDAPDWRRGERVGVAGAALRLDAAEALRLGVADAVVGSIEGLHQRFGFDAPPPVAKPNWAHELIEALAETQGLSVFLLMLGFVGLYVELHTPGIGVGGFVAAVAFLLFFWSHSLNGEATWLEALLFCAGVLFILMELLVLPGLGVFGLGGALLVIVSLVLASQTFVLPRTEAQLDELRGSLSTVVGALAALLVVGAVLRRVIPETRWMRRMRLAPPEAEELVELERREAVADYRRLIGRTGAAVTHLMPSGRAEIDGELVDVTAEHDAIDRGAEIEVVSARGARVVVRQVRR